MSENDGPKKQFVLSNMQDVLSLHSNSRRDNNACDKPLDSLSNGGARDAGHKLLYCKPYTTSPTPSFILSL